MSGFGFPTALKTSGLSGTPFFANASVTTDPGNTKQVLSFTVPVGTTRTLHTMYFSCTMRGKVTIKADGLIIGIARTAPGKPDINFPWFPGRDLLALQELTVEFLARANSPIVDCDCFIMSTDT
jgi:hypothetical protein